MIQLTFFLLSQWMAPTAVRNALNVCLDSFPPFKALTTPLPVSEHALSVRARRCRVKAFIACDRCRHHKLRFDIVSDSKRPS